MNIKETKLKIIEAGHRAVEQLIKVAKEAIIENEREALEALDNNKQNNIDTKQGFAERRSK